jgi:pSer/pThr/pTyr-binding forkhead associated (FHA) protein
MINFESMPCLVNMDGHDTHFLDSDEYWLGRTGANDISVGNDRFASRRHAVVKRIESDYFIEDFGSRNGTFVNGERIDGRQKLRVGDRVFVGNTCFLFAEKRQPSMINSVIEQASELAPIRFGLVPLKGLFLRSSLRRSAVAHMN